MEIIHLSGFHESEFDPKQDFAEVFDRHGLMMGRLVSGSKSRYVDLYPNNNVVFNGNIVVENHGKVWYGDIDITLEKDKLQAVADELCRDLYILREMDGRFENENAGMEYWRKHAVEIIKPEK
jgi:hypothetical protein